MKVLMVEAGKLPYEMDLDGTLKSMQEAVGGTIESTYPYDDPVALVCNDEGKMIGLPLNRAIYNDSGQIMDIIAGNFFMAGIGTDNFTDLSEEFMQKYKELFRQPEEFLSINGEIVAFKMPTEDGPQELPKPQNAESHRIFVDMDGVLAEFNPIAKIEDLYEQGYFANLQAQQNVVDAVKLLCKDPRFEVFILSSVLDSDYALCEKNQWLDAHIPEIDKAHRLFPSYGDIKQSVIPDGLQATDMLLDDYSLNLNAWCPPGQAVKLMNGINGNHGTWQGMKVYSTEPPEQIANTIADYALGEAQQFAEQNSANMLEQTAGVMLG